MFGVAPPQTLYHTRAPTASPSLTLRPRSPAKIASLRGPATPPFRFASPGKSSKSKSKDPKRPGTGDSTKSLIENDSGFLLPPQSSVYMRYRHSLNSLNDIIDRVSPGRRSLRRCSAVRAVVFVLLTALSPPSPFYLPAVAG